MALTMAQKGEGQAMPFMFRPRDNELLTQLLLQPAGYGKLSSSYFYAFLLHIDEWQQFHQMQVSRVSRLFVHCHNTD